MQFSSYLRSRSLLLVLTAALGLNACSVLPEPEAPKSVPVQPSTQDDYWLPGVVVIGGDSGGDSGWGGGLGPGGGPPGSGDTGGGGDGGPTPVSDPGGGSGGGGGGPQDGAPTLAPTVTLNISLTPCQTTVFTNLQGLNNGMLAFIVQKFGGTATGYNWRLLNGTLDPGTYGNTSPYNKISRSITSTFDANQWRNASDLSVARTMMHESVHAYLLTYFANTPQYASFSYPELVKAYRDLAVAGGADANIPHHNVMGQGWLSDLAWGLQQYGQNQGYNLPDQYYADMSWGGLEASDAFRALSPADQARISNLLRVEATGRDSQGNYQPQGGRPAGCP